MAVRNIKLIVAYDGFDYSGWQVQPGKPTIQEELDKAVSSLVGKKTHVFGASRTDAHVSALGQVAFFQTDSPIPTENFPRAITQRLPDDIVATEAVEVGGEFNIIQGAKRKLYRYTIFTGPTRPVLEIRHCWHLPAKLDVKEMQKAATLFVGKKDFKSFATAADNRKTTVRTIFRCEVTQKNHYIYVDVEGDNFLYNMVRNIVGILVDIGACRRRAEEIPAIIEKKDRTAAGSIASASGLCLMWIEY